MPSTLIKHNSKLLMNSGQLAYWSGVGSINPCCCCQFTAFSEHYVSQPYSYYLSSTTYTDLTYTFSAGVISYSGYAATVAVSGSFAAFPYAISCGGGQCVVVPYTRPELHCTFAGGDEASEIPACDSTWNALAGYTDSIPSSLDISDYTLDLDEFCLGAAAWHFEIDFSYTLGGDCTDFDCDGLP